VGISGDGFISKKENAAAGQNQPQLDGDPDQEQGQRQRRTFVAELIAVRSTHCNQRYRCLAIRQQRRLGAE
jgi:hypothetical protein